MFLWWFCFELVLRLLLLIALDAHWLGYVWVSFINLHYTLTCLLFVSLCFCCCVCFVLVICRFVLLIAWCFLIYWLDCYFGCWFWSLFTVCCFISAFRWWALLVLTCYCLLLLVWIDLLLFDVCSLRLFGLFTVFSGSCLLTGLFVLGSFCLGWFVICICCF